MATTAGIPARTSVAAVLAKAFKLKDTEGVLLFSTLVGGGTEAVVDGLLPVMHLVQEERLLAWQDDYFGEIFIRVLEDEAKESDLKGVASN